MKSFLSAGRGGAHSSFKKLLLGMGALGWSVALFLVFFIAMLCVWPDAIPMHVFGSWSLQTSVTLMAAIMSIAALVISLDTHSHATVSASILYKFHLQPEFRRIFFEYIENYDDSLFEEVHCYCVLPRFAISNEEKERLAFYENGEISMVRVFCLAGLMDEAEVEDDDVLMLGGTKFSGMKYDEKRNSFSLEKDAESMENVVKEHLNDERIRCRGQQVIQGRIDQVLRNIKTVQAKADSKFGDGNVRLYHMDLLHGRQTAYETELDSFYAYLNLICYYEQHGMLRRRDVEASLGYYLSYIRRRCCVTRYLGIISETFDGDYYPYLLREMEMRG